MESRDPQIERVRRALEGVRGGFAKVWEYHISHSCLRIRFDESDAGLFLHDCGSVFFAAPAWSDLEITVEPFLADGRERYRVVDGDRFAVDCGQVAFDDRMQW